MWPQGGNRVKRNGEKVTETVKDLFFLRNDRFWPITAVRDGQLSARSSHSAHGTKRSNELKGEDGISVEKAN